MLLSSMHAISAAGFVAAILLPSLAHATCYWQNSTLAQDDPFSIATDDTACFPDQQNSPCCGTGWTCLSDGLCYIQQEQSEFYYRGTCTDRSWDSQQCPGWCFAQNSNSSIPMQKCNSEQDWYCCPGDDQCDCQTGKFAVKLGATQPTTVTVIGSTSWPGMTSTTAPFTEQPLNTQGTTSASTDSAATTTHETSAKPTTSDWTSTSGAPAAASSTGGGALNVTAGDKGSSNVGLAAGLGAGLGAAAVVIAGLAFFLIRSRRRKNRQAEEPFGQSEIKLAGTEHDSGAATAYSPSPPGTVGNGYGNQNYYDPPKQLPLRPEELPAGRSNEMAELDTYRPRKIQQTGESAELGG